MLKLIIRPMKVNCYLAEYSGGDVKLARWTQPANYCWEDVKERNGIWTFGMKLDVDLTEITNPVPGPGISVQLDSSALIIRFTMAGCRTRSRRSPIFSCRAA